MNIYIENKKQNLENVIDYFKKDIGSLRAGRANPAMLESVQVEAYGVKNQINAVANIAVSDARSIVITPWDKSVLKDLEKAIVEADLGVGVVNEGDKVRINIPEMTEEKRKELVKKLNEKHENARISARRHRDEIKEDIEKAEQEKEITEDDKYKFIEELDAEIRKVNDELKEIRDRKEEDVMKV